MDILRVTTALALALAAAPAALAQPRPAVPAAKPASTAAATSMAIGEILEIDTQGQRVLVKHGPIASIGMDAMTMEFLVPDRALLRRLRPGDRIRFSVAWRKGEYEITRAEVTARQATAP